MKRALRSASLGDQEQTLSPRAAGIQNAVSDCGVVFHRARLISLCRDEGSRPGLASTLP